MTTSALPTHPFDPPFPEEATCAAHPTAGAPAVCSRCGIFSCAVCSGATQGVCRACQHRALEALPGLDRRARTTSGWLIANAVTTAMLFATFVEILRSGSFPETSLAYDLSLLASLCTLIGAIITFLRWWHLTVRTAIALGHDVGTSPGWAVGGWFVPIVSLWMPYQLMRAVLVRLGGAQALRQSKLGLWWGAWLLHSFTNQLYAEEEAPSMGMLVISMLIGIGAAVAAVNVVRTVTAATARVSAQFTGDGSGPLFVENGP